MGLTNRTQHQHARRIFTAALKAADPIEAVGRYFRREGETLIAGGKRYALGSFDSILVIGAGKASAAMAQAVERALGKRISAGWINTKYGHGAPLKRIHVHECSHPVPDEAGVEGARRIVELAESAGPRDLVIALISGGASALTPSPAPPITLAEKQETTKLLLACGANIHEINAIRKHISTFKGGQLARAAAPATVIALMLSDVIGDSLESIGSGPTAPDPTTFASCVRLLEGYAIDKKVPAAVLRRLREGAAGEVAETPKAGDAAFARVRNLIVGSNALAVDAAAAEARALGYRTLVLSTRIEGETRDVAGMHAAIVKEIRAARRPLTEPACLISGGETTVTIRGDGLGGRNQEFALACAIDLAGMPDVCALSGGTDGTDGPTDAAGAIADGGTLDAAAAAGMDARAFLARNDSYHFFDRLGLLLKPGPTRTNVMDVRILLAGIPGAGRKRASRRG
ncbi:MAG: glycerate kinase [Bryobacterales bacterium]|nr:glycerate kinase [Bryobacterales bacterium]